MKPASVKGTVSAKGTVACCKTHLDLDLGRVQKLGLLVSQVKLSPPYKYKGRCIVWN